MNVLLIIVLILTVGTASWAKSERTYYTEEMMTRMSEKIAAREWAKAQVEAAKSDAAWYIAMSDQEIWDFVPPPEQLRAINVHIGHDCPNCGPEITRKAGHYPWILDRDKPFKLTCPSCDLVFPENDFEPWNTEGLDGTPETGTAIIDKGLGWIGPEDRQYYFVPYYIFWQRWVRDILGGMRTLGRAYLVTGDPEYGRKCAIMMAKVASEYERFDYGKQAYHEGKFNIPGRISDRIWSTGDDSKICLAYDAIFPAFADDDVLLAFLADKGIADPRDLIEQKMLNVMAEDVMSAFVAGNMGMHQRTLCHLAIVLANDDPANGPTTEQMRDWIMTGPGRVEDLLWNGFWRDGLGSESSPSYSSSWCNNFYSIADLLPRLGVEIWDNPKLKRMADVGLDTTVAGAYCPSIGDSGGMKASGPIARSVGLQGRAFTHYGDARYAKALALMNATSRDLFEDYFDEDAVATVVAEEGTDLGLATRDLGGYGLAVLESGEGDHKRAATMYYGFAGGGHGHRDRLNIQMWAYKKAMLTEDGYPFPFTRPDFWAWRSTDTVKHYCVVVDETTQRTQHAGDLNTLASTPTVQFMDASAEVAYPAMVSLYRRTTAMIDISDEDSYLLDIFRVRGGSQHDWCFHGPGHFELSVGGGEFGPTQEQGTLAGENVPYGTRPPRGMTDGVTLDLLAAKGLTTEGEYRDTSREGWAQFGQCILVRKEGASVTLDMPELPAGRIKVAMRIYDYNEGSNTVDVTISGVTQSIDCEPSGTVGYRWISGEMDIPTPATEVMLGVGKLGQTYVQIDELSVGTGLGRSIGDGTSGFHGLYNVRRMTPDGLWTATWTKADEDLGLTMTMPASDAREVIVADASPELQPGNPDVIQYVLGRNALADEAVEAGEQLFSKYVSVIEPHRGAAEITGVEYLQADDAEPETVGLAIHRGETTDLIHSTLTPERECIWTGGEMAFTVTAEFALVTLDAGGVQRAVIVNGTSLEYGDFSLQAEPSPAGEVLDVDFATNSITIDADVADAKVTPGSVMILGNDLQSTSYTIEDIEMVDGETRLGFGDVLCVIGMGAVTDTDAETGTVASDRELTGYGRVDGGLHVGRWLYNEDRSQGFRISKIDGSSFTLESGERDLDAVFTDADGDGRRVYWISDIGPGDTYRIPTATHHER